MVERAYSLLSQLPATAPDILEAMSYSTASLKAYRLQSPETGASREDANNYGWESLQVSHHANDLVLRFALHSATFDLADGGPSIPSSKVIDSILVLLETALQLSSEEELQDPRWVIVIAYLWTSWQRCLLLHLWMRMASQLDGYNYNSNESLYLNGIQSLPKVYQLLSQQQSNKFQCIKYLCGWSFRSLQDDRTNLSMDFRRFFDLYSANFGDRPPACNPGPAQCNGSSSQNCKRFRNTEINNQSMHDFNCRGSCGRLFWSRDSFVGVSGPRAVDIASTDNETLRYRGVTEKTLTISHVWSHGQGGRPDKVGLEGTGFNVCLHRRYADIAISLGCDSYWMDTPCIPSEKDLKRECLSQINDVFSMSAMTLTCDKDIMTIDMSSHKLDSYESILATLLVCDWTIRAWTLLEAMRGRFSLYILCLHNRVLSLDEVIKAVHAKGRIDLVTLLLGRDYLFPPAAMADFELFPGRGSITSEIDREIEDGFLSIGEAAVMLSHRHATRDGDDLLIWSLLIGDIKDESPIEMWKRQVGKEIPTGSLISSARRVERHPGLSWAPYVPTISQHAEQFRNTSKAYPAYDGSETSLGLITDDGLRAKWLIHEIPNFESCRSGGQVPRISKLYTEIANQYLHGFKYGILLLAAPRSGPRTIPVRYRGVLNHVVVICASHDRASWGWRGLFEWDANVPLPQFTFKEVLIA